MPKGTQRHIPSISDSSGPASSQARKHLTRKEFAARLYNAMMDKGWTQAELSRQSNVLRDSISNYVRGNILPDAVNLKKLAKALGMKEADLLPNIDEQALEAELNPALEVRASSADPSRQWIKLNREVNPSTVIKIMQALEEDKVAGRAK